MVNIDKDKMILDEIKELTKITKNVPKDKRIYVDRLIEQASFMYATLKELQDILNDEGTIELFQNGSQQMLREHPAAKLYNNTIKNYTSIIKQLSEITPPGETETDPLKEYLNKKKK